MIKKRFISMLVLLAAVVTGAWAEEETLLTTITPTGDGTYSETTAGAVTVTPAGSFFYSGSYYGWQWDYYGSLTVKANEGYTIARCVFIQQGKNQSVTISKAPFALNFEEFLCLENYSMDGVTSIEVYGTAPAAPAGYAVSLKAETADEGNWTAKAGEGEYQSLPLEGVAANTAVSVKYGGTKKVKSVKAVKKAAPAPSYDNTLNINTYDPELNNWENVTVPTGKHWLIEGTGAPTYNQITIADGGTVTLSGVNMVGSSGKNIICEGDATIILADGTTNDLIKEYDYAPAGIEVGPAGKTLTIQGNTGVLNISGDNGAAIGAGGSSCGNIVIEGGIINATSGDGAAIGGAYNVACGNITISGGTVTATSTDPNSPGIGCYYGGSCGDITITDGVTSVTATKGSIYVPNSIGAGLNGSCGTITIGGTVYPDGISTSPYTYDPSASAEPAEPTLADVFTDGAVVGVAVKNTYNTYTVTGTYSGGSYTSITKSSNDIQEVTMTKDGNNLVVWIKSVMNSECTLTFNTQDNTYTKSFKAGTGAAVWDLSEFVSITVNGTDITSTLTDVTPAAAETTVTWTSSDMPSDFFAQFYGWTYNNTHQGITVTASGDAQGGWSQNRIDVNEGSGTITFTSSVGNIKSIVITADNMNEIDEWSAPSGWTANEMWNNPRTLSWSGTASASVNLPLSDGQNFSNISTIVFTLE